MEAVGSDEVADQVGGLALFRQFFHLLIDCRLQQAVRRLVVLSQHVLDLRFQTPNPPRIGFELQIWTDPDKVLDGNVRIKTNGLRPDSVQVTVTGWSEGLVRLVASTSTQKVATTDLKVSGPPTAEMTILDALEGGRIIAGSGHVAGNKGTDQR